MILAKPCDMDLWISENSSLNLCESVNWYTFVLRQQHKPVVNEKELIENTRNSKVKYIRSLNPCDFLPTDIPVFWGSNKNPWLVRNSSLNLCDFPPTDIPMFRGCNDEPVAGQVRTQPTVRKPKQFKRYLEAKNYLKIRRTKIQISTFHETKV